LAIKHGTEVGGRARCWGDETDEGKTEPPKDVRHFILNTFVRITFTLYKSPQVTFVQLVSGSTFSCGITITQTVQCWGGIPGQQIPEQVPGLFTQITASELYACGVRTDGSLLCWGHSHVIRFMPPAGLPNTRTTRAHSAGYGVKFVQVSCSAHHCCALDSNAHAHCFGYGNSFGEIYPPTKSNFTRVKSPKDRDGVEQVTLPDEEEEEEEDEEEDEEGEEGEDGGKEDEDEDDPYADVRAPAAEESSKELEAVRKAEAILLERLQFKQISVGEGVSCGLTLASTLTDSAGTPYADGDLVCWGNQQGHMKMAPHTKGPFKQVSVGPLGVCAIYADDAPTTTAAAAPARPHGLQCWGFINNLFDATEAALFSWDQVAVGSLSMCAVTMISELQCWGTGLHDIERRPLDIEIA
jgi:hypothetical protein